MVLRDGRVVASSLPGVTARQLPDHGDLKVGSHTYRVATFTAPDFNGSSVRVAVLSDLAGASSATSSGRLLAVLVLGGFLVLAFAFAVAVSRSLQSQIARFLDAARRLGSGDFSTEVPTEGRDEFAALGGEFNKMSHQLEARLDELKRERARLQDAVRRIGESVASNLDREALLDVVLEAALDGVDATGGRATVLAGPGNDLIERGRAGTLDGFTEVITLAEQQALDDRRPRRGHRRRGQRARVPAAGLGDGRPRARPHRGGAPRAPVRRRPTASCSPTSPARPRSRSRTSTCTRLVQRQAVTDELTGLFNHRRFQEVMAQEVERAKRFGHELGLIMLDIDNFKSVNDTYGHLQGDVVLREVARVLRESSREIDEPARYGGEEMAVALPQTDLEGAYQFAERVRTAIEALRIARLDGAGAPCASPRPSGPPRCPAPATPQGPWSPPPTPRSTRPSARARTDVRAEKSRANRSQRSRLEALPRCDPRVALPHHGTA